MEISEQEHCYESETEDTYDSDDSQEDPSFDVAEETRFSFSNLSINRKIKACYKGRNEGNGQDPIDEQDQKSYETIEKIIQGGQIEKLKVDQCKIYLRKHGLRLSGNKETLIQRIKEHSNIVNGDGEKKYPASSFVLNCKGDACTGDVVIFEQNVYEMFNIASRSANGPPCGTRVVAGRIVKESYGAAKQQHTFTIEVLWSKGEKSLPPLHPLLIKGRNLYRLKTMRQKWQDEGERYKILSEKHARGGVARLTREERIQHKELRKSQKPPPNNNNRTTRNGHPPQRHKEEGDKGKTWRSSISTNQPENLNGKPNNNIVNARMPLGECLLQGQQPLINIDHNTAISNHMLGFGYNSNMPMPGHFFLNPPNVTTTRYYSHHQSHHSLYNEQYEKNIAVHQKKGHEQKQQICRFYPQGRCHFGDRCKYLHE